MRRRMPTEIVTASYARDLRSERAFRLAAKDAFLFVPDEVVDVRFVVSRAIADGLVLDADVEEAVRLADLPAIAGSPVDGEPVLDARSEASVAYRARLVQLMMARFLARDSRPSQPDVSKFKALSHHLAALVWEVGEAASTERRIVALSWEVPCPPPAAYPKLLVSRKRRDERALDQRAAISGMEEWLREGIAQFKAFLRRVRRRRVGLGLPVGAADDLESGAAGSGVVVEAADSAAASAAL